MILFDRATALDVLEAFRLLDGRRRIGGRRLADGVAELLQVAERSLRSPTVGPPPHATNGQEDDGVDPHLLTLDDVKARTQFGLTKIKSEIRAGRLHVVHAGRLVRVHSEDLTSYLERLRQGGESADDTSPPTAVSPSPSGHVTASGVNATRPGHSKTPAVGTEGPSASPFGVDQPAPSAVSTRRRAASPIQRHGSDNSPGRPLPPGPIGDDAA